ncbi:hypothetical protein TNCV_3165511 [Trichonephila clavipes]|nr:hypothetical protein TNCV_3165511 [Trichonephila clavipes]
MFETMNLETSAFRIESYEFESHSSLDRGSNLQGYSLNALVLFCSGTSMGQRVGAQCLKKSQEVLASCKEFATR